MPKYLTAGWETVYFIVTPRELKTVLDGMHLLHIQSRVPADYRETPLEDYLEYYQDLYEKRVTGQPITTVDLWLFHDIGVTAALDRHGYGETFAIDGETYRMPAFDEPTPYISHFPMYCFDLDGKKPQLTMTMIVPTKGWLEENTVGLELLYPKKIQYPADGDWTDLESTKALPSYQDFLLLKQRIHAITKPLRVMMQDREVRTRIRVSPAALEDLEKFPFFRNNPVRVIR